ncbi:MAG: lactate utilization protein C, partial [Anaerolineae bacterium]
MNEVGFLQRVAARVQGDVPHPGVLPVPARTLAADWVSEFAARLTAVGGHVYHATDAAGVRVAVRDVLHGRPVQRAVLSGHEILAEMELDSLLGRMGVEVGEGSSVADIAAAEVGITGVEYAIAASGTLVMAASPHHPRTVSLLPPLHIAIVRQGQLLPDLAALARQLDDQMPSGLALITGPRRTADIEQTLSIGVHGPAEV